MKRKYCIASYYVETRPVRIYKLWLVQSVTRVVGTSLMNKKVVNKILSTLENGKFFSENA